MVTRQELKQRAKAQLGGSIFSGRWLTALLVCLIATLLMSVCNVPSAISRVLQMAHMLAEGTNVSVRFSAFGAFGSVVLLVLSGPLNYGKSRLFLKQARDGADMNIVDLFKGFSEDLGGNILLALAVFLFTFLWSLVFVIPGIVKGLAYSLVFYVKADHPDYDWKACINESKRLTQGHKGELFMLYLSFIGWYIVGALCFGVGTLWVTPYLEATVTHFYQTLLSAQAPAAANEAF